MDKLPLNGPLVGEKGLQWPPSSQFFFFLFTLILSSRLCFPHFILVFFLAMESLFSSQGCNRALCSGKHSCNQWTCRKFPLCFILEEEKLGFEIRVFVIPWQKPLLDLISPPIPPPADSSPPFTCALSRSSVGMQWRQGCPQLLPR